MANTTNFGWETPDDTDLVKDGAAAIRTLGSSIDTSFVDLKGGTTGQLLSKASNTDLDYTWVAAPAGGKVLQVIQAVTTTSTNIASTSYTDTNLTATITPSSATSKILILAMQSGRLYRLSNEIQGSFDLLRNSSSIRAYPLALTLELAGGSGVAAPGVISPLIFLDSPNTTSATTYKVQAKVNTTADSGQFQAQSANCPSIITLLEIGA